MTIENAALLHQRPARRDANWRRRAHCLDLYDPEVFFPAERENQITRARRERRARAICTDCPVRAQCLDYALELGDAAHGVWAGTSDTERRTLARQLRWLGPDRGGATPQTRSGA